MCFHPDFENIPYSPWQKSPSTAIRRLIECSRYSFKQNKDKAESVSKIGLGYKLISQDTLDHCKVLGISYPFTLSELKKAYRELAFKHHPDTGDGDNIKLGKIYEAYEVLSLNI